MTDVAASSRNNNQNFQSQNTNNSNKGDKSPSKLGPKGLSQNLDHMGGQDEVDFGPNFGLVKQREQELNDTINDLDAKMNRVLVKQEYEYLKGYNIYVKRKEKELKQIINDLKKENKSNTKREEKINNLEKTISQIREEQV